MIAKISVIWAIAVMAAVACPSGAFAWDVEYDAATGLLPTAASPTWTSVVLGDNTASVCDGSLLIQDSSGSAYFTREPWAIDAGVPVTMEARMKVSGGSSGGAPAMGIQTRGCLATLSIYSDHLAAYSYDGSGMVTFSGDFTTFRTVRLAYDGGKHVSAWVDGQLAVSWTPANAGQNGIWFGAGPVTGGTPDSNWQYVAYSKALLPVPEPSSPLAFGSSIVMFLGLAVRRRCVRG